MTATAAPKEAKAVLRPGSAAFTIVLSMAMGMTALAIDSILPAFDAIGEDFGLASDSTDLTLLVSAFMIGLGLGQIPAGLLADRFGRRPVLWGGVVLYIVGAAGMIFAPSLELMIAARFVWGLGGAGPRVAVTAMVRDSFQGEAMAKQMSTIMAVFLLVPMFAPSAGAALVAVGSWHLTAWMCAALGILVFIVSWRLPATLPVEQRRLLSRTEVLASWKYVLSAPGVKPYLLGLTVATGAFLSYLASSENIFDVVFGLGDWFPVIFGVMALGLAGGAIGNGRVVERVGLDRMLAGTTAVYMASSALMVAISLFDGTPPFALFAPVLLVAMMSGQLTLINGNTAAMIPLGKVAGSGAALLGMVPMVGGSILGSIVDRQFDGTITPLSVAFLIGSTVVLVSVRHAANVVRSALVLTNDVV